MVHLSQNIRQTCSYIDIKTSLVVVYFNGVLNNVWFFFSDVKAHGNARSPLLAFCDAVMASVSAVGSRPNHKLSDECVECVLNENRLDLLAHWIAQDRYIRGYIYTIILISQKYDFYYSCDTL